MKIAIINEVSACPKNQAIVNAAKTVKGAEILNAGMKNPEDQPQLTYIHTGYMAAMLLNSGACDFVVGGCGTGQGFLNSAMQFPGVFCGLIIDPLDAWLFSQINGGNCVSLPLNKGYGWAGDLNLKYVFEKLFSDPAGRGYPPERADSQAASREALKKVSRLTHKDMAQILRESDPGVLKTIAQQGEFLQALEQAGAKAILERLT